MQLNSVSERLIYDNARRAMENAGVNVKSARLTQSFLRLEQLLVVGRTSYTFPVMFNQNVPQIFNTEQRLNMNDAFVISSLQMFIAKPASATDGAFKKYTYPNLIVFSTGAAAAYTLYNGILTLQVDNVTFMPAWDLERHLYIPETQQTAATASGIPMDEYNASNDGFYPVEPNIVLAGNQNVQIAITLPAGIATVDANARVGLHFRGILAQNAVK